MEKIQTKYVYKRQTKKKRIHEIIFEKIQKNWFNKLLKKTKENVELKSVEVDMVSNFIKNDVESFSDIGDHNNEEEDRELYFDKNCILIHMSVVLIVLCEQYI